ncbi:MAG: MFS transporter [Actinomycetia bacterium]|nr:MFS transporter [Actinomycetes bacterium]
MSTEQPSAVAKRDRIPYKWIVLTNTTIGVLMASVANSSLLIALPEVFRGIKLNPLAPENFMYLLWMLMGYGLVLSVLVVTFGRIGDMFGRVKMYNLGFLVFSVASVALSLVWSTGPAGAIEIIAFRMVQAVGGAMLMANSAAILTDVFPSNERGMALGTNQIAGLGGGFVGLVLGGLLAAVNWRLVFLVNVPIGLFGTVWAYTKLRDTGERHPARIDWLGMVTFALGLGLILLGVNGGLQPYGGLNTGWTNPAVLGEIAAGVLSLVGFVLVERHTAEPMFDMSLFKIRPFAAGNIAVLLSSVANGGMQFMFIMWLQGIWLPLHGYSFEQTPMWAGIFMLPLTVGFMLSALVFGRLSDKYGARPFATGGMLLAAATFAMMLTLPANFSYAAFAVLLFMDGLAFGMFSAPNTAAVMNSVPARNRGVAAGMRSTAQSVGQPLSMGVFFSLMVFGLSTSVPSAMFNGLTAHHVAAATATTLSKMPPTGYLFSAFLGFNPVKTLLGPAFAALPASDAAVVGGKTFFPQLIGTPFIHGLAAVLMFSAIMCLIAAGASWLRGGKFVHEEAEKHHMSA